VPPIVHEVLRSPGQPLDSSTRAFMEPRFGHDFSQVRVHTDIQAAESTREVHALAYTVGRNIVFGLGQYVPATHAGKRLLAHELTHSVQQEQIEGSKLDKLEITQPRDAFEREADIISKAIIRSQKPPSLSSSPLRISRETANEGTSSPQTQLEGTCGPDVTDWFISTMNAAKTDPRALAIKQDLDAASRGGARYGYSATDVLEGGVARKVLAAERTAGNPPRTAAASLQLGAADPQNQFGRAILAATAPIPFAGAPEQMMLGLIRRASLGWKNLVETGAVWDFKNNVLSSPRLATAGCSSTCIVPPTVTICGRCYEHNLPGDLFYAYIGKFCGFSLNALQLGSQYAELQPNSSSNWDPPADTAAIDLGFNLPPTIARTNLCASLNGVTARNCTPCQVTFSP
jgi:hypothetical protein